jgi:hypothetical protein
MQKMNECLAYYCKGIALFVVVFLLLEHLFLTSSSSSVEAYCSGGTSSSSYHLISLRGSDDCSSFDSSSTWTMPHQPQSIRDLWRWKDDVLGNGHDFFTPRPRAIQSLISLVVGQTFITTANTTTHPQQEQQQAQQQQCWTIEECAILSNCARFDIYLLCKSNSTTTTTTGTTLPNTLPSMSSSSYVGPMIHTSPKSIVANILASQLLEHYQTKKEKKTKKSYYKSYIQDSISAILDRPDVIRPMRQITENHHGDTSSSIDTHNHRMLWSQLQREVQDYLLEIRGVEAILRHTCLVACGMAQRPNRPHRQVVFQPFSSRDAHILLQFKRTIEITHGSQIRRLLQASLSVGKAARDVRIVPQILPLRKIKPSYGTTTTTHTFDRPLIDAATSAVLSVVLEPAVQRFLLDLRSREHSTLLWNLRQRLEQMVLDAGGNRQDLQQLHKILHLPTIALREGREINEEELIESVSTMLKERVPNNGGKY